MKLKKKLHRDFVNKINRLLYIHGQNPTRRIKRDGFMAYHDENRFYVELDGQTLLTRYAGTEPMWASDKVIRAAITQIETLFVLDDLANL